MKGATSDDARHANRRAAFSVGAVREIKRLAEKAGLSIRKIKARLSTGVVGRVVKKVRFSS